jgi:aminopeptidase YwaD
MPEMLETAGVTGEQVSRAFAFTDEVVERYPGRVTGTEALHEAARRIRDEFAQYCDAGSAKIEEFDVHPGSFLKYLPGLTVLYLAAAVLLYFNLPWPALACIALAVLAFTGQFLLYWHLLDPLFPKCRGYNVVASIDPEDEIRQQVIVSAHHDAAYVFHLLARAPRLYFPLMRAGAAVMLLAFLVCLTAASLSLAAIVVPQWVAVVLIVMGVFVLSFLFFTTNQVVPGAGDNMVAVAIAGEIGRIFGEARRSGAGRLKHTRIVLASFDAEECGMRGARAFVRKHRQEIAEVRTYVLNMDTLYRLKDLNFFRADRNSMVKLSYPVALECRDIARAMGYRATVSSMSPGGGHTDAAAFGEAGVEATNLCAMSYNRMKEYHPWVYHTANDVSKYVERPLVAACIGIIREYIIKKDAEQGK